MSFHNGETGLGKTQWARSLLPFATVVSHRDQLRDCMFGCLMQWKDYSSFGFNTCCYYGYRRVFVMIRCSLIFELAPFVLSIVAVFVL